MKIGLLGGSFNPVHNGHLTVATRVREKLKLDRILFIPTAVSPLKRPRDLAPPAHRWAMLKLALHGNPTLEACDVEIRRGGVSYTVDTLREIRQWRRGKMYLILGADAAKLLPKWKAVKEVLRLARLVLVARPGHSPGRGLPKHHIVEVPLLEISGSEIRDRIRKGRSVRYLVPDGVERYVRKKRLYR